MTTHDKTPDTSMEFFNGERWVRVTAYMALVSDYNALAAENAALRAENDRLRVAVRDLLGLMPDDEGPEIDAARAALDAKP